MDHEAQELQLYYHPGPGFVLRDILLKFREGIFYISCKPTNLGDLPEPLKGGVEGGIK